MLLLHEFELVLFILLLYELALFLLLFLFFAIFITQYYYWQSKYIYVNTTLYFSSYLWYHICGGIVKKKIIINDIEDIKVRQKLINNKIFEWVLYMVCYAIVLITVSLLFDSLYINNKYFGLYALIASVIIYILNQTIKPVLFYITLPITALTYGLFYPIINVIILYITSFILGNNFSVHGIIIPFIMAIIISVLNIFMEGLIIKPIVRRTK